MAVPNVEGLCAQINAALASADKLNEPLIAATLAHALQLARAALLALA